ncbi:hypothetical protein [Roseibium polysiphoniae]|uniref:hypothetical protein n=1 Tax=Roseibium polysiphoniae TaxID=2571221 RepID=UPI003299EFA2
MTSTGPISSAVTLPQSKQASSDANADTAAFNFEDVRQTMMQRYLEWTELPEDQRIRHRYLSQHGLDESGLSNLSPSERAIHEEKIAEISKQPVLNNATENNAIGDTLSRPVLSLHAVLGLAETSEEKARAPRSAAQQG